MSHASVAQLQLAWSCVCMNSSNYIIGLLIDWLDTVCIQS